MTAEHNPFEGMYDPESDEPTPPVTTTAHTPVGLPVTPGAHPPVAPAIPVAQPPVAQPPVAQPPVAQPPVTAPANPAPVGLAPAPATGATPVAPAPAPTPAPAPAAPAPVSSHGIDTKKNPDAPVMPNAASTPGVSTVDTGDDDERVILDELLVAMVERGGSDLHLSAGSPPVIRVRGEMQALPGYSPMTPKMLQDTMYSILNSKQRATFEEKLELDLAYAVPGQARFRVNVMKQRGSVGAVMRTIPWEILSLDALGLPDIIGEFANLERGLVLVTGPTGSGKSTTLASVIDRANRTRSGHIITIEDPVEFLHQHRGCVVNQREVGEDTHSFQDALKHVLRQDPDIILVGELRDLETISVALTAAETGHLVFATLHTQSAQDTITRVIDVFPPEQQQQVRTQLASSLQGVVCQTLCKTADGTGRQAAVEIMVATPNIRSLIREDKLQQIQGALQSGGKFGMQTLNNDLAKHVLSGRITAETALEKCSDKEDLITLLGGQDKVDQMLRATAEPQQPGYQTGGGMSGGMGDFGGMGGGMQGGYVPPPV